MWKNVHLDDCFYKVNNTQTSSEITETLVSLSIHNNPKGNHNLDLWHHKPLVLPVFDLYRNRIIQQGLFCTWSLLISWHSSIYLHVVVITVTLVIQYSVMWIYHNVYSHSSLNGHLDCFQFGAIMNIAEMNILAPIFWWTHERISVECIPRSGIVGS